MRYQIAYGRYASFVSNIRISVIQGHQRARKARGFPFLSFEHWCFEFVCDLVLRIWNLSPPTKGNTMADCAKP